MAEEQEAPQPTGDPPAEADANTEAANAALHAAQAAVDAINAEASSATASDSTTGSPVAAHPTSFAPPSFDPAESEELPKGLDLLSDVDVNVTIELGRTRMLVEDVLRLAEGAVVELDKLAGDPVDVFVNERLVARGEVLVLNDNFCIRVNEILDADAVEDD
ncbi:MAG: flagellar motor switch protein FliN [Planctomycetota bacterium]